MADLPPRRVLLGGVLALLLVGSAGLLRAGLSRPTDAVETGPTGAAAATQDGWWSRLQGPIEGEPAGNPVRPLLSGLPPVSAVPADTVVTSAEAGQVDKVAAVGLEVALPDGVQLEALTLRLKESLAVGANLNSKDAKVLVCPASAPWGGHKNANWVDRPQANCGLGQVPGIRADDGTWTFDLTPFGTLWTDPSATLPQNGVVLSVDPAATVEPAQVGWLDFDSGNVAVEFLGTAISSGAYITEAPTNDTSAQISAEPPRPVAAGEVPPLESGPQGAAGDSGPLALPAGDSVSGPQVQDQVTSGSEAAAPVPSPAQVAPAAAPRLRPRPQSIRSRPAAGFWEDLPIPTVLLIPVVLGLALLLGLALGPAGRPQPVGKRAGGLSRALDRRRGGDGDAI
jgi:hypothetical protein